MSRQLRLYSKIKEWVRIIKSIDLSRYAGVLVVLFFVGVYGLVRILSPQSNAAQLRFVDAPGIESSKDKPDANEQLKNPFSGPEHDHAVRLRETSALGMAISLSLLSFNTRTSQLPQNVSGIIGNLTSQKLWPPGVELRNGVVSSEQSTFHIAYRREPFSFEVLAISRSDRGSQILFRFPLPQSEPNSVLYFEAKRDQPIPSALLTTEQLSASGWKIRHWRGDALTLNATTIESLREQSSMLGAR
ncbi:MAG: hypothetical protein AB7V18_04845 [Pyrinomonadaceae bacterium]